MKRLVIRPEQIHTNHWFKLYLDFLTIKSFDMHFLGYAWHRIVWRLKLAGGINQTEHQLKKENVFTVIL